MRFQITRSALQIQNINNTWESINLQNTPHHIGIFHYASQSCYGGWIKSSFPFVLEFEGSSYIRRNIGNLKVIEITVDTVEQLNQISHQISEYLDEWKTPKKIESIPNIYKLIDTSLDDMNKLLAETNQIKKKLNSDMTFIEAEETNWNAIRTQLSFYRTLFNIGNLPERFVKKYTELRLHLGEMEKNFQEQEIYSIVLQREIQKYLHTYESLYNQYKTENFTLDSIAFLLEEISNLETKIKELWNKSPNWRHLIDQERNEIVRNISDLRNKAQEEFSELERVLEIAHKRTAIEKTVLQQLRHLSPGIQTLLTRICELTDIDKELVEDAILHLVKKHKDLGTYHKTSQVFILGEEMNEEINNILGAYPQSSFEESIRLIEQGVKLPNPLNIVVELHKRIKSKLKELLNETNQIDFIAIIDRVAEQGIITPDEQQILHKFRMSRNALIHDKDEVEENFSSDLILLTKQILNRIMDNQPPEKNPKPKKSRKNKRSRW